jgi:trimethylamine--corrinoid protein Co-methyltransferase
MPTNISNPTASGTPYRRLSPDGVRKLHWAALQILERTGVRLHHPPAVELLRNAGARVSEGNRVRIPPGLVEQALESAPKEITLYDREGQPAITLGGQRTYYGTGSDCLNIIDHRSGQRRKPILKDVVEGVTLCDALPNIDFVMCMFLPVDVPTMVADRYQMVTMLNHTTKPIIYVTTDLAGCLDAVAMAEAVVGGVEALRARPLAVCYVNVTNALQHNQEALQKLLYLSGKGLPTTYIPVALGGVTAPITLAGNMAIWHAGCLVGLALSQLNQPGAPFITSGWGASALDMRTAVSPYVEPEKQFLAQELAHSLGLPMFAFGGISDAKLVDQQAALEAALTLMCNTLAGSHLVHDLGYLESGLSGSLAQLAICDELIGWIRASLAQVEISDETLALDLIDQIGPDGDFLGSDHTLDHFRSRWYPELIERDHYEGWSSKGTQDLGQRAGARVERILAEHQPAPLPEGVQSALRKIIQRAEEKAQN